MKIRRLSSIAPDFQAELKRLLAFEATEEASIESRVSEILAAIKARGDEALIAYTARFDRFTVSSAQALLLLPEALKAAFLSIPEEIRAALHSAAERIRAYHTRQLSASWQYEETDPSLAGTILGQKISPIARVGLYVPGGKAAYPSSVLMNAIPAKVAGVSELIMVTPTPDGEQNPIVLAAAYIAGVDRVFCIGGAQAIGALAYGTETVPRVDKIVGPGNAYVAAAKRRVFGQVGIDMVAGPSEILIIADGTTPPDWVAMDLFSQAEHDELAQAILISPDAAYLEAVSAAMQRLLPELPRHPIVKASIEARGALIHVQTLEEACALANQIAPEHLELSMANAAAWVEHIHHAGAIFVGAYASEALGDYCAGPNHVLPTAGSARFSSPLGVYDFQKRSSVLQISSAAAATLGGVTVLLAESEGLGAHARSAQYRMQGEHE